MELWGSPRNIWPMGSLHIAVHPASDPWVGTVRSANTLGGTMSLSTILIIILVLVLLGGFSGVGGGPFYGGGPYLGGGLGLVLLVLVILVLLGRV
jgi:hypothetical protein